MALDNISSSAGISLSTSNLYANGRIIVFADGTMKLIRDRIVYSPSEGDDYYTVKINDTLTGIAYKFFKNKVLLPSRYWWVIADANQPAIRNPLDITHLKGKEIVIPNILNFKLTN